VNPNGSAYHLSPQQYAELGNPSWTGYVGPAPQVAPPVASPGLPANTGHKPT
jgi:hypothetical protein